MVVLVSANRVITSACKCVDHQFTDAVAFDVHRYSGTNLIYLILGAHLALRDQFALKTLTNAIQSKTAFTVLVTTPSGLIPALVTRDSKDMSVTKTLTNAKKTRHSVAAVLV